jgi:hypothetical protein
MKEDEGGKKSVRVIKDNSVKLTRKDSFRVSENLHFYFGGEEICIVKRG